MAIAYLSQGAGVSTETSGVALSPLCPATVTAGDILIAHVFWEGTTDAPSTPTGWTLLGASPYTIQTTIARHWFFGRIADGTEDGTAVAFGAPAVATQRGARVYSFSGRVSGAIDVLIGGITHTSHANDPQGPSVTTPAAGALAVALVGQNDNNAFTAFAGESGGSWAEAVAEYSANLTPGLSLGIQVCTPTADPGTVSGGSDNTGNDPCGVIGFWIRDQVAATASNAESGSYSVSGAAATAARSVPSNAESGSYAVSGAATTDALGSSAGVGSYSVSGVGATSTVAVPSNAESGSYAVSGAGAVATVSVTANAAPGTYSVSGVDAQAKVATLSDAGPGSYSVSGAAAAAVVGVVAAADPGSYSVTGFDATAAVSAGGVNTPSVAGPGEYSVTGVGATAVVVTVGTPPSAGGGPWWDLAKLTVERKMNRDVAVMIMCLLDEDD